MTTPKETDEIIYEIDSVDGDEIYRAQRGFFLIVRAGPAIPIQKGQLVRLTRRSARELFPGGILPITMTDQSRYEVIKAFSMADQNDLWVHFSVGDILELTIAEALLRLKKWEVKPTKGGKRE